MRAPTVVSRHRPPLLLLAVVLSVLAACSSRGAVPSARARRSRSATVAPAASPSGAPSLLEPDDVYAADRPGHLSPVVRGFPSLVYVPNSKSNTVDVIDPATDRVVDHFGVGQLPQHVVPSWDLKTLWVTNDLGNSLTPVDPATGKAGQPVPVEDPYNMYFTPDGRFAVVVAERLQRLDFRDAHTMQLVKSVPVTCRGVDHMDFSADGTYLLASCEFSGSVLKVDVATQTVLGKLLVKAGTMPQDVKLSADGKIFYVADQVTGGVYEVDGADLRVIGFLRTGRGTHGLYVSRDSKTLFVTNRGEGSVSLVDLGSRTVRTTWRLPGGGSPDMGGLSADGKLLWLSGRYNSEVYALDAATGRLVARIPVGAEPHGLCVYPQPGRYSLGHTGVFR